MVFKWSWFIFKRTALSHTEQHAPEDACFFSPFNAEIKWYGLTLGQLTKASFKLR